MSEYKVTERVIALVEQLFQDGYSGTAELTTGYCTGTSAILGNCMSVQLTGFCKEALYVVESSDGDIVFVGRYDEERRTAEPTVADIVAIAWSMYQTYKGRSYSLPSEFQTLFEKHGYIIKRTRVIEEVVEKGAQ